MKTWTLIAPASLMLAGAVHLLPVSGVLGADAPEWLDAGPGR